MLLKVLFGIILLVFSLNTIADTKKQSEDTIPFVAYKVQSINSSPATVAYQSLVSNYLTIPGVEDIDPSALANFIKKIKMTICGGEKNMDVRVWLSAEVSGKLIVGISALSGLEVTFHCK